MRQVPPASPSAAAKAQLLEELRKLEQEEAQLKYAQTLEAFDQVVEVLTQFGSRFNAKQKSQIASLAMTGKSRGRCRPRERWWPNTGFPIPARLGPGVVARRVRSRPGKAPAPTRNGRPIIPTSDSRCIRAEFLRIQGLAGAR